MSRPNYPVAYRVGDLVEIAPGGVNELDNLEYLQNRTSDFGVSKITLRSQFRVIKFSRCRELVCVVPVGVDVANLAKCLRRPTIYAERFRPIPTKVVVTRRLTVLPHE